MNDEFHRILDAKGIVLIDKSARPRVPMHGEPAQTRAGQHLWHIYKARGTGHFSFLCSAFGETENNRRVLTAPVISGLSDLIWGHPSWADDDRFLPALDAIPLDTFATSAAANRHVVRMRPAIATMLFTAMGPMFQAQPGLRGV